MNTNNPIHPKSLIRYHWGILLLTLPLLVHIVLFQVPAAKLSAFEIPMSLLIGPAVSVSLPVAEVSNQPFEPSVFDDMFDHNFESSQEVNSISINTVTEHDTARISHLVASVERVTPASLNPFSQKPAEKNKKATASKPKKPRPEDRFIPIIMEAAQKYQVDPDIIKAIIKAESGYNPKAVSNRGAKGLMQLMPRTAKSLGVVDLFCPEQNILGGVKYFKKLLDQFNGDIKLALAAYNAGSRKVRKYKGVPPFKTTRLYIKKVFKYRQEYQQQIIEKG
jgi:hypothetical protein